MKNEIPRIDALWAFLSVDPEDGNEGLCGHVMPGLGWVALVAADEKRVESLRPLAITIAEESGMPVRLVKFTVREDLEVFDGGKRQR